MTEHSLHIDRGTCFESPCSVRKRKKGIRVSERRTWHSVIIEAHSIQVRVRGSVVVPPFEDVFVLYVFGLRVEITGKLVDIVDTPTERRYVIKYIFCCRVLCFFWLCSHDDVVSESVGAVVLIAKEFFGGCDPGGSPASALEIYGLVAGM